MLGYKRPYLMIVSFDGRFPLSDNCATKYTLEHYEAFNHCLPIPQPAADFAGDKLPTNGRSRVGGRCSSGSGHGRQSYQAVAHIGIQRHALSYTHNYVDAVSHCYRATNGDAPAHAD
jgi:hypothetical protein